MRLLFFCFAIVPVFVQANGWGNDYTGKQNTPQQVRNTVTLFQAHAECKNWLMLQSTVENGRLDLSDDATQLLDGIAESCNDINETYTQTMRTLNHYNTDVNDVLYGRDVEHVALRDAYNKKTATNLEKRGAKTQKRNNKKTKQPEKQVGGLLSFISAL